MYLTSSFNIFFLRISSVATLIPKFDANYELIIMSALIKIFLQSTLPNFSDQFKKVKMIEPTAQ